MARTCGGRAVKAVRVAHSLGRDGAKQRLDKLAQHHGIALEFAADGYSGELEKSVAFIGKARATFIVEQDALTVHVVEAPTFLSEETVRRKLEEELSRVLA